MIHRLFDRAFDKLMSGEGDDPTWMERNFRYIAIAWHGVIVLLVIAAIWIAPFFFPGAIPFLWPLPAGYALGYGVGAIGENLLQIRRKKIHDQMVGSIHFIGRNDANEQVLMVTRNSGEQLSMVMPEDYDPREDAGVSILRAVNGDLFSEREWEQVEKEVKRVLGREDDDVDDY